MLLPQVIAVFHIIFNVIGLPGNLLVLVTIVLVRRLHLIRYILLASLAVSDFLCLILTNSFRIASISQETWPYGQTLCYLNPFFLRYFYLNTVLHLIAVSYERYKAIVKSPLTYDGTITRYRALVVFLALIWIVPIPFSIGPFLGWGKYVYNPEVYYCEQGWSVHDDSTARNIIFLVLLSFVLPFLVILFLNWSVLRTVQILRKNSKATQATGRYHEMQRKINERRAAVDVSIIIAAFVLCYLPFWITGLCRQYVRSVKIPAEVVLVTMSIFFVSSLCNPIIYSIRKREFRRGVKIVLRRMGVCKTSNRMNNSEIGMSNASFVASVDTVSSTANPTGAQATQHQNERSCERAESTAMNFQRVSLVPTIERIGEQLSMTELTRL